MLHALLQIAEHKRAVDKLVEEKRARYEAARAADEAEEAARCVDTRCADVTGASLTLPAVHCHGADVAVLGCTCCCIAAQARGGGAARGRGG